jgi:hypothetical protein
MLEQFVSGILLLIEEYRKGYEIFTLDHIASVAIDFL